MNENEVWVQEITIESRTEDSFEKWLVLTDYDHIRFSGSVFVLCDSKKFFDKYKLKKYTIKNIENKKNCIYLFSLETKS